MKPILYLDTQKPNSMFLTGTRVDEWVDANGNGRSVGTSSLGTGYNPTFSDGAVHFSGANQFLESPSAFTELNWARGFTVLCAGHIIEGAFAASDSSNLILGMGQGRRLGLGTMGNSSIGLPDRNSIFGLRWDRAKMDFILNGKIYPVHEGSPINGTGPFGVLQIGLLSGGAITMSMLGIQLFDAILDDLDVDSFSREMMDKYGIDDLPPPRYNIVVDGNSLAVGYFGNNSNAMWDGIKEIGASPNDVINVANSGISTASLIERAATVVDPLLNLAVPSRRRILIVWEISNDLSGTTQTDTAAYGNIKSYCQARKAAGWRVIACTCLPRTQSGINTNFETYRLSVNASILANAISEGWADAIADIGSDPDLQDADNTTYFNDKTHLTSIGHEIAAGYITDSLASLL